MKTIMVIDDDQQIRELVELSLKITSGWKVIEATSGHHAVERLREQRPDAILLDFHMPDLNGLDTLKLIRETPEYRSIPIIAYTADPRAIDKNNLPEGLSGVLLKPFAPDSLAKRIADLL
jgi:CheY-like chemotaxis protein